MSLVKHLIINKHLDYGEQLKRQITSATWHDFLVPAVAETPNLKHNLYELSLPGCPQQLLLKELHIHPTYAFSRKIELYARTRLGTYSKRAFQSALKLKQIGIKTFTPAACWQSGSGLDCRSYLLMEKLPSTQTLRDLYTNFIQASRQHEMRLPMAELIAQAATIVSKLHAANLRHGDITLRNFLVAATPDVDWYRQPSPTLYLIDLDHCNTTSALASYLFPLRRMRCLKRIELQQEDLRHFLDVYLGSGACPKTLDYFFSIWTARQAEITA